MMVSRDSLFCRSTRKVSSEQRRMTPSTPAQAHTGTCILTAIETVVTRTCYVGQGMHAQIHENQPWCQSWHTRWLGFAPRCDAGAQATPSAIRSKREEVTLVLRPSPVQPDPSMS